MRTSTNYRFNLPELSDVADVTKLTANWESLDPLLRAFAVGLADVEDTVHRISMRDLPAIRQSVTDVSQYAESVGASVSALDTEIHTTRPYVDTNTEQTIMAKKHIPTATVNDSSDMWVNKAFVQATDGRNNLLHNIGNETIEGTKHYKGTLIDRISYGKNASDSQGYMATFKLPTQNKKERFMIASFLYAGRSSACGMFTIVWDESSSSLSVRESFGNPPPAMCIASDPNDDYWLCFRMNINNALQFFNFLLLRTAGFTSGKLEPVYTTSLINVQTTQGWSIIREGA